MNTIELKRRKTCNSCIAFSVDDLKCELKYGLKIERNKDFSLKNVKPIKECPKPLTIKQAMKCKNQS